LTKKKAPFKTGPANLTVANPRKRDYQKGANATYQKGRPRKVISQGKAKIAFTGKAVTAHAGMALISRSLEHLSVRENLQQLTADLDLGKHHPMSELLEQLIAIRMMGGEAISDTALLKDDALAAFFDWEQIAHPSTFGRRLAEMRWSHNLGLQGGVTGLSDRVLRAGQRLVAIDSLLRGRMGAEECSPPSRAAFALRVHIRFE
jgi:hypothetical protein